MDENIFQIMLQAMLDKIKSIANIKVNIKAIETKLPKIKLQGTLLKTATQKEVNSKLKSIRPKINVDADITQAEKKIKRIGKQKTKTTIITTVDNSQVVSGLQQAQKETKTLWERFTSGIIGINLVRMSVQRVTQSIREAITAVKELDTIKTNIQMVSGTSDSDVNAMMSSYNAMAKDLNSTTKDVAEAANEFLRMGESIASTNELIKSSQVLSKVGMINSADAASYLISSLKGYQVVAEDSMDIVSKLTSVDLEAAVSAGGLAEALSKCANIANNSGVAMDRLIGYTATVGETTQKSMSEVGNSFQALLSRMNNIKIGRFIDDETGESLSDTEAVLSKLGIQLRDTENTYRSFDDVLDDVGSRWERFTKVEQNALAVAIAGTRQRENFEALMNNWGNALKYSETAANSAGSALERYGVYQDSIQAKTNELTAAIESLSTSTISEELYSGIIEATTGIVEFLDKTNLLKASLAGLIAMGASKAIASMGAGFITAAKSTAQLSAAMVLFDKGRSIQNLKDIGQACIGLSNNQLKLVLSTKNLTYSQRLQILESMGVAEAEREQMLTTLGFAAAEDKATVSTFSLKGAFNALKTAIAMNPIGIVVTAVSVATMVFSSFNRAMEEVRQKTKELGNSFKDASSDIESYKSKIEELYKTINDSNSSIEDVTNARQTLMTVQDELIDKFGDEKETIDLVTQAIYGQTSALDTLTQKKWQEKKNEFNEGNMWNDFANWQEGYSDNIDRMVNEMENAWGNIKMSTSDYFGGEYDDIIKKLEETGWKYSSSSETFVKDGSVEDLYEEIVEIQALVGKDMPDNFLKSLTDDANKLKDTLDDYEEMWDAYILNDRIFTDKDLADSWKEVNYAYSKYQNAVTSGNTNAIEEATAGFATSINKVLNDENVDDSVKDYFRDMYPALYREVEKWEFKTNIVPKFDTSGLQGKTQADVLKMLQTDGTQDGEDIFNSILESTDKYGLVIGEDSEKIQQLLDLLVQWGVLQGTITDEMQNGNETPITFDQAWADSFTSKNDKVKELGNALLELAEQGRLTIETFNNADSTGYFKELGISADEAVLKINKLVDESKQLSSMSNQISAMSEALNTKLENGFVDADTLSGFDVEVRGLESWDKFQEVLGSTTSSYDECQEAANALATEWVNSSDFLAQLTGQNEEYYKTQLESMGIENYEEVISYAQALNEAKKVLTQSSLEFGNATYDEIEALIAEGQYSELTANMILALYNAKVAEQAATIDTSADCANLIALAGDTDRTSQSIQLLIQLMDIYSGLESGAYNGNRLLREEALGEVNRIKSELEKLANGEVKQMEIEPTVKLGSKGRSSAKSAGKEAGESYKDGLKDELSDLESVISSLSKSIDEQKEVISSQKEVALEAIESQINALEEERDARLAIIEAEKAQLEAQIKLIDKQIKSKQDEIKAIETASDRRKKELDLQKAQFEFEKMMNMRTQFIYDGKQMVYRPDESGARDAKEKVDDAKRQLEVDDIEREIDLLQEKKDLLNEQIDILDEQADSINKFYDSQVKALEKQKESTEKYFEMLTKAFDSSKDKYQELLDIVDKAELSGKLKKLGIDEEALLNGSEEEFQKLKDAYMGIVFQLNEGNEEVLSSLRELSGYEGTAPTVLSDTTEKLGEMNTQLEGSTESMDKLSTSATTASEGTSAIATNMSELNTSTEGLNENLTGVSNAINGISTDSAGNITTLAEAFTALGEAITSVAEALGIGEEVAASGIVDALTAISEISLGAEEEGIIGQFNQLKTSVDSVTSAISGGGSEESGGDDKGSSNSSSPSMGEEGSSGGLSGAITEMGNTATETLGEAGGEDGEGEGEGVISKFNMLKTAVDNVTTAIGVGGEEGEGSEENANTLIGALQAQYEKATEVLPETKSLFEELLSVIESCVGALNSMVSAMTSMQSISMPSMGGSVSVGYNGTVGKAFADGTTGFKNLPTTGYKGLPHDEKNTLRSEYGQTELTVYPNGEAEVTTQPTMADLPKGTVIFNEEQTKKIMNGDGKAKAVGKAYANGTRPPFSYETFLDYFYNPPVVEAPDPSTFDPFNDPTLRGIELFEELTSQGSTLKSIETHAQEINRNVSTINTKNIQPSYNISNDINITCPGVTSQAVMNELGAALDSKFSGLHLDAYQQSMKR